MLNIAHFQHLSRAAGFVGSHRFLSILSKSEHLRGGHHFDRIFKSVAPAQVKPLVPPTKSAKKKSDFDPRKFLLQFAIDRVNVTSVKIEYLVPYLIFQAIEQDNETGLDRLILPTIQVSWSSPERLPR